MYLSPCLPSLSFVVLYTYFCLLVGVSPHWASHIFVAKISSSIRKGISFQTLECLFVTELRTEVGKPLHFCLLFAYCHMFLDRCSKVLWKLWVQLCSRPSAAFSSDIVCFKIRNQLLGQIIITVSSMKSVMLLAGKNVNAFQPVETKLSNPNLSTSYFPIHDKIVLWPIMQLCGENSCNKDTCSENFGHSWSLHPLTCLA